MPQLIDGKVRNLRVFESFLPRFPYIPDWLTRNPWAWENKRIPPNGLLFPPPEDFDRQITQRVSRIRILRLKLSIETDNSGIQIHLLPSEVK